MHGQNTYAYGMWPVVAFNILLVLFFALSFIKPKQPVEWRSMGLFIGFIVALFTEMYGLPLTVDRELALCESSIVTRGPLVK